MNKNQFSLFKDKRHQIEKGQIQRYTSLFGLLFTEMYINKNGKDVKVPIRYGAGHARNKTDTKLDGTDEYKSSVSPKTRPYLPMIAFTISDISEDSTRRSVDHAKISSAQLHRVGDTIVSNTSPSPEPHNIRYELIIRASNKNDSLLIYEQIVSAFGKGVNIKFKDQEALDVYRTISIKKEEGLSINDNYENVDDARIVEITIYFTLKGFLYQVPIQVPVVLEIDAFQNAMEWMHNKVDDSTRDEKLLLNDILENFLEEGTYYEQ